MLGRVRPVHRLVGLLSLHLTQERLILRVPSVDHYGGGSGERGECEMICSRNESGRDGGAKELTGKKSEDGYAMTIS